MGLNATANDPLTDEQADAALDRLPKLPTNVLIVLRNQQRQIDALSARLAALEA